MADIAWIKLGVALGAVLFLAGCNGKPEEGMGSDDPSQHVKTPLPPYPAWANPMINQPLSSVARGSTICKGKIDNVSAKHDGARKGSEVEGWAWDESGAKPIAKVVFTNPAGRIIGAANTGGLRKDVPPAMKEVTTPYVGWKGVIGALDGSFRAVGLSANNASCIFDTSSL